MGDDAGTETEDLRDERGSDRDTGIEAQNKNKQGRKEGCPANSRSISDGGDGNRDREQIPIGHIHVRAPNLCRRALVVDEPSVCRRHPGVSHQNVLLRDSNRAFAIVNTTCVWEPAQLSQI